MSTILNKKEMKNAVVFLATGFEEIEALGTIDVLRRGGVRVMMVSITGCLLYTSGKGSTFWFTIPCQPMKVK